MRRKIGTGMGAALFTQGVLVPNLELGHHPLRDGMTYEDLVRDSELKRLGPVPWTARVIEAIEQITGAPFKPDLDEPIARIRNNLAIK